MVAEVPKIHDEILQNLTMQSIRRGSNMLDYSRGGYGDENFLQYSAQFGDSRQSHQ